jgi:hypothetical protein
LGLRDQRLNLAVLHRALLLELGELAPWAEAVALIGGLYLLALMLAERLARFARAIVVLLGFGDSAVFFERQFEAGRLVIAEDGLASFLIGAIERGVLSGKAFLGLALRLFVLSDRAGRARSLALPQIRFALGALGKQCRQPRDGESLLVERNGWFGHK